MKISQIVSYKITQAQVVLTLLIVWLHVSAYYKGLNVLEMLQLFPFLVFGRFRLFNILCHLILATPSHPIKQK